MKLKGITTDEANILLKKEDITEGDVLKFASVFHNIGTLNDQYEDLTYDEKNEIHELELSNLNYLFNVSAIVSCATGYEEQNNRLINSPRAIEMYDLIEKKYGEDSTEGLNIFILTMFNLCYKNTLGNDGMFPFCGKIPKKMFCFRQSTAETWWDNVVKSYRTIFCFIFTHGNPYAAMQFSAAAIAYYLNNSQPDRFNSDAPDEISTIREIQLKFANTDYKHYSL